MFKNLKTYYFIRIMSIAVIGSQVLFSPSIASNFLTVGIKLHANYYLQPGFEIGFRPETGILSNFTYTLGYTTSRWGSAVKSNALQTDMIIFSIQKEWGSMPLNPHLQVDIGMVTFNPEDPEIFSKLKTTFPVLTLLGGIRYPISNQISVSGDIGYALFQSVAVTPLHTTLGIDYAF